MPRRVVSRSQSQSETTLTKGSRSRGKNRAKAVDDLAQPAGNSRLSTDELDQNAEDPQDKGDTQKGKQAAKRLKSKVASERKPLAKGSRKAQSIVSIHSSPSQVEGPSIPDASQLRTERWLRRQERQERDAASQQNQRRSSSVSLGPSKPSSLPSPKDEVNTTQPSTPVRESESKRLDSSSSAASSRIKTPPCGQGNNFRPPTKRQLREWEDEYTRKEDLKVVAESLNELFKKRGWSPLGEVRTKQVIEALEPFWTEAKSLFEHAQGIRVARVSDVFPHYPLSSSPSVDGANRSPVERLFPSHPSPKPLSPVYEEDVEPSLAAQSSEEEEDKEESYHGVSSGGDVVEAPSSSPPMQRGNGKRRRKSDSPEAGLSKAYVHSPYTPRGKRRRLDSD